MPKIGSMLFAIALGGLAFSGLVWAAPAQAAEGDLELWTFQEWWSPVAPLGAGAPSDMRVGLVQRFASRTGGFQHSVLRVGPQWALPGGWAFGAQAFSSVEQYAPGRFLQEQRLELEPRWVGKWGPWGLMGRGRFEARALPTGLRDRWRAGLWGSHEGFWGLSPQASAEAFLEPQLGGLNQWRFMAGLGGPWWGQRAAVAYLLRPRLVGGEWLWDQGLVLNWTWRGGRVP